MHLVYWFATGIFFLIVAGIIGSFVPYRPDPKNPKVLKGSPLGILIDNRGRFSLTSFQVVAWTWVLLSLLSAVFIDRLVGNGPAGLATAMNIGVPQSLLILAGISGGSAVLSSAVKATKIGKGDPTADAAGPQPQFRQVFMVEEGDSTDKTVDVTKFQGFFFTVMAILAYLAMAGSMLAGATHPLDSLPDLGQGMTWLIGISHAAYIGGKIPDKE
jgi:hypothetical protein